MSFSFSKVYSAAFLGLDAVSVEVEATITSSEKPLITLVGLPDTAVKESKERVFSAIRQSGFKLEGIRCTINLAPGELKKEGAFYDLPIALSLLRSLNVFTSPLLDHYLLVGELGLNGEIRPVRGILSIALLALQLGKKGILVPRENGNEASIVQGIDVIPVSHLKEALDFFKNPTGKSPLKVSIAEAFFQASKSSVDFADIKGQHLVKRALEIAAAGGHNVLLSGAPGSGKTMAAKALLGILPALTLEESLEVTKIHSIAGLLPEGKNLVVHRPFRSPHHTVSYAGMVGGGTYPRPGEVSLAHRGVLFLDELPEFSRTTLEVLRQPLEDRTITVSRAQANFTFPSDFICIAAMNPCPCGFLGHPEKPCRDTELQISRYRGKISGPLLDRLDMHVSVAPVKYQQLMDSEKGESSECIGERVKQARFFQKARLGGARVNAQMHSKEVRLHVPLDNNCKSLLREAIEQMGLSARGFDRILKVARTIADLGKSERVLEEHLMEALQFRSHF